MREIDVSVIRENIAALCISANLKLPCEIRLAMEKAAENETNPLCKSVLGDCVKNMRCAEEYSIPICQDTGMAVIFLDIGQDVHFTGGSLEDAVCGGVAQGYVQGRLRRSIVNDPLRRVNTGDNTPPIVHTRIVSGNQVSITVAPKGFGSENMSAVKMFNPSAEKKDIIDFIVDTVKRAGGNPCPPIVVGVGIGGDFEYSAYLSKKALCRNIEIHNSDEFYAEMEKEALSEINRTGIGAQGFGGDITALGVNIEQFPTHIAGLPVAVNIGCHVTRHAKIIL